MGWGLEVKQVGCGVGAEEGEDAGGDVVEHDAGASGEALQLTDGRGLEDVEEAEEEEGEGGVPPVGGEGNEGDELTGDLVDDDVAGVFTVAFAGDDGGGGDADGDGGECGCEGGEGEGERGWVEGVSGTEPEEDGGDGAVGAGAGAEEAGTEEGGDEPGPAGFGEVAEVL